MPLKADTPAHEVLRSGREIILADRAEHDRRWPDGAEPARAKGVESSATLPRRVRGATVGAFGVARDLAAAPPLDDVNLLRAVAVRVGAAVERVVSDEREATAVGRARALLETANRLNLLTDESETADVVVEAITALTTATEAGVYLLTEDGKHLRRLDRSPAVDAQRRAKYEWMPADLSTPVARAIQKAAPVWLESAATRRGGNPQHDPSPTGPGT